ncbi:uncharacterized protein LOC130241386 [Danio aesculapii]|uniref:uncharacterized protein LOC130241386 n=1 Tax=Danio aesculapii TaxID=1142201 RepID=UPI0024BFA2A4|nr:uncharacterized protein LOC130241386 [Danio aesculapii]
MDIILGRPWLVKHDPILSWGTGEIKRWGEECRSSCFPDLPLQVQRPLTVYVTSVESPVEKRSIQIPKIYSSYEDVFCPKRASQLPPHRPWDCAIDLLPDAPMPRGRIYPLSLPETKAMEEYIQEALSQGYIRPSTSPAASSFFFVAKKDGGLRPCIDYRILNQGTVKFCYPLPLVPAALEQLRSAKIFTKLDLRSTYNLVRIREGDEWKTAFVTPTGHYEYLVMPYGLLFDRLPSSPTPASSVASVPNAETRVTSPLTEPRPSTFPSDRAKIAYVITLLSGKALSWATAVWKAKAPFCSSFAAFEEEFKRVFDHPHSGRQASKKLLTLQQGSGSVAEYAIHFRIVAAGNGWNNEALMVCFQNLSVLAVGGN